MRLTTLLLLPLLSSPLILALTTSSPGTLTGTNLTLPPLLPPADGPFKNLTTGLGVLGPSCFDPKSHLLSPVSVDSCLQTIARIAPNLPPDVYLLPRLFKTATADVPGGTKVPLTWKSTERGGCMVMMDNVKGMEGLGDAGEFSLIGAAYYASIVVANCVVDEKSSVGGRFVITDGGFFVDVRAGPLGEVGDDTAADAGSLVATA